MKMRVLIWLGSGAMFALFATIAIKVTLLGLGIDLGFHDGDL